MTVIKKYTLNSVFKQILIFIGLVLLQVLFLNKVNIGGYVNPYIFPLYILLLSLDTKKWNLLVSAFFLGLFIDLFNGTIGMHVFATVFVAYLRPIFIKTFSSKSDKINYPSLKENGFSWMLFYVFTLIFIHHFIYFFIEVGSLTNFFHTILLIFLSSIVSVFIIFLLLYTFINKK